METQSKQAQLEQIKADIITQNICPDLAQTATQIVMGNGNPDADIVFIGEAPGKKEDETGQPFVGASGKMLDAMLGSIDMQRSDVFITNIVKYRPPDNRDPSTKEKNQFLPFLIKQLLVIHPKVVITLGRHSMNVFLPDAVIGDVHGVPQRSVVLPDGATASFILLPLYHPAAAMYNGRLKQTLLDDFAGIPAILA